MNRKIDRKRPTIVFFLILGVTAATGLLGNPAYAESHLLETEPLEILVKGDVVRPTKGTIIPRVIDGKEFMMKGNLEAIFDCTRTYRGFRSPEIGSFSFNDNKFYSVSRTHGNDDTDNRVRRLSRDLLPISSSDRLIELCSLGRQGETQSTTIGSEVLLTSKCWATQKPDKWGFFTFDAPKWWDEEARDNFNVKVKKHS